MLKYLVHEFNRSFRPEHFALLRAEEFLSNDLDSALKKGHVIVSDVWGGKINGTMHCCAIGAAALEDNLTDFSKDFEYAGYVKAYYDMFYRKSDNFWSFVKGFDAYKAPEISNPWFDLGTKLRDKYQPKNFMELKKLSQESK